MALPIASLHPLRYCALATDSFTSAFHSTGYRAPDEIRLNSHTPNSHTSSQPSYPFFISMPFYTLYRFYTAIILNLFPFYTIYTFYTAKHSPSSLPCIQCIPWFKYLCVKTSPPSLAAVALAKVATRPSIPPLLHSPTLTSPTLLSLQCSKIFYRLRQADL